MGSFADGLVPVTLQKTHFPEGRVHGLGLVEVCFGIVERILGKRLGKFTMDKFRAVRMADYEVSDEAEDRFLSINRGEQQTAGETFQERGDDVRRDVTAMSSF